MRIDTSFRSWIEGVAVSWGWTAEEAALAIGKEEIHNRLTCYRLVAEAVGKEDWQSAFANLRQCWALGGQYEAIRLNLFVGTGEAAIAAASQLIRDCELDEIRAVEDFVDRAVELAYTVPASGSADRSGAALLASVILTAVFPDRFVDFRQNRWKGFAHELAYGRRSTEGSYGSLLRWAGGFSAEIGRTPTFRKYWQTQYPLWVVAGLCWHRQLGLQAPHPVPSDPAELGSYLEGDKKWRLHLTRERSQALVDVAKSRRCDVDPELRCEACGFSFIGQFGERGKGFIEAHHTVPLSKLRRGTRTRLEDIALVCANCHRMLHRNPETTVKQLRVELREAQGARG